MNLLTPGHLVILLLAVVILFGAKKLPEVARGLGRSARILKSEIGGLHDEEPTKTDSTPRLEAKADTRGSDPEHLRRTNTSSAEAKPSADA